MFEFLKRQELSSHERSQFVIAREQEWVQGQAPHRLLNELDALSLSDGSFSLNGSSLSDGLPDGANPPERSERGDNYSGSRSSGPAGDSEYKAYMNGSHSSKPLKTAHFSLT